MKVKQLLAIALMVAPAIASAHPGHGLNNAYAAFMHPLTGWDHLLVMLAVGLWAGKLGGSARWQLPVTFVILMAVGAVLGASGIAFGGLETGIAASVMALGLLLVISLSIQPMLRIMLIATFAVLHGMSHGAELPLQSGIETMAAMLFATTLLHLTGLALSSQRLSLPKPVHTFMGILMLGVGGYLMIA